MPRPPRKGPPKNASKTEPVHFYQIWILPEAEALRPEYEQKLFAPEEKAGKLRLVASRDGREESLKIHQNVSVYNAILKAGEDVEYRLAKGRHAWLQVVRGAVELNLNKLSAGVAILSADFAIDYSARTRSLVARTTEVENWLAEIPLGIA